MFLAVDIGNSSIKFGLFDGDDIVSKFSIPTKRHNTSDEIALAVDRRLDAQIDASIVCSVVPNADTAMREFLAMTTNSEPVFVDNRLDLGLKIDYEPIASLGTDRLIAAFAAAEKFGVPCIVCSFGTATTIDVVSEDREFTGGVIAPGLDALSEALHSKAPRLPMVENTRPGKLLGNSTGDSIRSGIYYGYMSMVEGLITRIRTETAVSRVIGTGGNVGLASEELIGVMTVEHDLVLKGLSLLAKRMTRH